MPLMQLGTAKRTRTFGWVLHVRAEKIEEKRGLILGYRYIYGISFTYIDLIIMGT